MSDDSKAGVAALAMQTQLTEQEQKLGNLLVENGQAHLFAGWGPSGEGDAAKSALLAELDNFHKAYPGGIEAYVTKSRALLIKSLTGSNPFEGYTVSTPTSSVCFGEDADANDAYEALGMTQIGQTAFVLVAGGLGERLGYNGIKIELPWETASMKPFLQHYIEHLLAYQAHARATDSKVLVQLGIMVSADTDVLTMQLLESNDYFGMQRSQVTVFKQGLVPALSDNDARFALNEDGTLMGKPHGHGDVHMLLYQQGIVQRWQEEQGIKWLVFFQDTNGLIFRAIPATLGVSIDKKLIMNYICSTRRQGDAVGAICTLTRQEGQGDLSLPDALTINVEYNQITGLLGDGKEPEVNGFSAYPGNTNSLVFEVSAYLSTLAKTQGVISEFVNPKYANQEKTIFKKPTRLECMMQDFPKLLSTEDAARVGFAQFPAWTSFSAVKNDVTSAAAKQHGGNNPECASSGEYAHYYFGRRVLSDAGVTFTGEAKTEAYGGVSMSSHAKIALSPNVGSTRAQIRAKFSGDIKVSEQSLLCVDGEGVSFESLTLDGALLIKAVSGASVVVRELSVTNEGWQWLSLTAGHEYEEWQRIRAFRIDKAAQDVYTFTSPGSYVLSDSTKGSYVL